MDGWSLTGVLLLSVRFVHISFSIFSLICSILQTSHICRLNSLLILFFFCFAYNKRTICGIDRAIHLARYRPVAVLGTPVNWSLRSLEQTSTRLGLTRRTSSGIHSTGNSSRNVGAGCVGPFRGDEFYNSLRLGSRRYNAKIKECMCMDMIIEDKSAPQGASMSYFDGFFSFTSVLR
jgi:hypothetical protein